jgi:murein DD-endopeptidase MepM/ murein hydrolase activator NlpD
MFQKQAELKKPDAPVVSGWLQRACACGRHIADIGGECEECKKRQDDTLQRAAVNQAHVNQVPSIVHEVLRSSGQPLDVETRNFMEPRFGHDFSNVRLHTDSEAIESAQRVNALAYTVGPHVVFGASQYAPRTSKGLQLMAHELTHVVQQASLARTGLLQPLSVAGDQDHITEREADQMAAQVMNGQPTEQKIGHHPPTVMRATGDTPVDVGKEAAPDIGESARRAVRWLQCTLGGQENPVVDPLADISTFQSPGASGWWGAMFGCYRNGCTRPHAGWDIHAPVSTPIRAVVTGTMTRHDNPGGYGQYVMLRSKANPQRGYLYAHLSRREPAGDYCPGDKLGETGTTGNASADRPHLHFQVQINGVAVDPVAYLNEPNQVIEATGSAASVINKALPPPCAPC